MENPSIEKIINTFFKCDKAELLKIFDELLTALEAEENALPSKMMSQNYETAQANPEIHTLPGNLKDARDSIFPYFWGTDGWYSKLHLENVRGARQLRFAGRDYRLPAQESQPLRRYLQPAIQRTGSKGHHRPGQPALLPYRFTMGRVYHRGNHLQPLRGEKSA